MKIRKLLIANRGEIAVRIIRSAQELGISTVAIYSEVDVNSLHVLMANEAYLLGKSDLVHSYLNQEKIIAIAKKAGAQAIHPGYGFLSENAEFAEACKLAGLIFIGPKPSHIRDMGDKIRARLLATNAKVPVIPGTNQVSTSSEAKAFMQKLNAPVLIKCAGGGGGHGMRLVSQVEAMESAFRLTRSEGLKSFGNDSVYLELSLSHAKHIEVQVFGLGDGEVLSLLTRACSVQRRNQKVIEEAPAPSLTKSQLRNIEADAKKLAGSINYIGAGTVEFLLEASGKHYFLEMNTRLQVEHPVTEMVLAIDLVAWQIQLANAQFSKPRLQPHGHAIECRIYAENPLHQFAPAPGILEIIRFPAGPFVRVDSGIYPGYAIPLEYDPLIAKITTWGENREVARLRMLRALQETILVGTQTNLALLKIILQCNSFIDGNYSTQIITDESILAKLAAKHNLSAEVCLAIAAAYLSPPPALPQAANELSVWQQSLPMMNQHEN